MELQIESVFSWTRGRVEEGGDEMGTTMLDQDGLLDLFTSLSGRRFVGAVDSDDAIELVFDGDGCNMVTIFTSGRFRGNVWLGFVAQPREYCEAAA